MRLIFAGTPEFAAHHLQILIDSEHELVGVYTQPDRRAGRGKKLVASPVKQLAEQHQLPVFQPVSLKDEAEQQQLRSLNADVMVVVAYGLLLPQPILDAPRFGCINVHASLLPRWRGAAPIQRAVEAGDSESGITIMQMDIGLDTGDMLVKVNCPIEPAETGGSLHDKLMHLGGPALLDALNQIEQQTLQPEKQNDAEANYANKLSKEEAAVDWQKPARELLRQIHAFNPFPVAYFQEGNDRIRIWQATVDNSDGTPGTILSSGCDGLVVACGEHSLRMTEIQLPGKKPAAIRDILNGHGARFATGRNLA
ncbi:methionyl-tRNA formyltransferase [Pseudomaricurvus alkylphenolicus]|jgi:methionyl-tRNA formyltransferase|uniref:methionyl-tRNA formyltransferase n=1 Tax=Pseudomaricurvus alkylphenolicus TaxID=1306991 RepID=UPI001422F46B|nr:methionyl-tRNA formyltransferase [Pseudomaricurvus alkylphenolicus]NIB39509.1 methionyl-tRNA formyltransferase [Pseudomaricurvus alkylphenolicus]